MKAYRNTSSETDIVLKEKGTYNCRFCGDTFGLTSYTRHDVLYNPTIMGGHDGSGDIHCHYVYVLAETGSEEMAWTCPNNCFHHDESTPDDGDEEDDSGLVESGTGQVWVCGECSAVYEEAEAIGDGYDPGENAAEQTRERARECCK